MADLPDEIVLAVDYGTSNSGLGFAYAGNPEAALAITISKQ